MENHHAHHGAKEQAISMNRLALSATVHCLTGCSIGEVLGLALAADTLSIVITEIVDNGIMLVIPGAMDAGLSQPLFGGSLLLSLILAGVAAYPANRWLIMRGAGHVRVLQYHRHH